MRHQSIHPLLVRMQKTLSSFASQGDSRSYPDEIIGPDHSGVDRSDDHRIPDKRPELLHQIERQGRAAETWLMNKADKWVKPDTMADKREILYQQTVCEGKQCINRVHRR